MKVLDTRILRGPNIHSLRPCFLAVLDLEELDDKPSSSFPDFTDRLIELLPGIKDHRCSTGYRGGFVDRLREGTYPAHITEHVLIELQCAVGIDVGFGKARTVPKRPRQYTIVCSYKIEKVVTEALPVAIKIVEGLARGEHVDITEDLKELRYWAERYALGPSTNAIVEAAARRGIPLFRVTEGASLFQLGWGKHMKRIQATVTSQTSHIAVELASDKDMTKAILAEAGLPVPSGEIVRSAEAAIVAARRIRRPVALKPFNGNQGKGVSLNLTDPGQIAAAYDLAAVHSRSVIVERYITGQDYRVLVVGQDVIAAACRRPANVIGDGDRTITALVDIENTNPMRGNGHMKPMTWIKLDESARQVLDRQGYTFDSVPPAGELVVLKENANLSTGGAAEDVTHLLHPSTAAVCVRAALAIGLDVCGIDIVCDDISEPLAEQGGAIIEVNAAPGIRMHQHPSKGKAHDVGAAILESLFPKDTPSRIPVITVTGTNGKTTTALMIGHTIQATGAVTGVTTTEAIYVNGRVVQVGDCTGYWSARSVLTNPMVEAAVLETARGGMLKRGLAFDVADVGVVLNIQDDHLGQHGIETLEDLARVKKLVVTTAKKAVVLNAEDSLTVDMAQDKREGAEVLYFTLDPGHPVVARHLEEGGRAVYLRRNMIMLANGFHHTPLVEIERIPATLRGRARHNIANAAAAIAALWAAGYTNEQMIAGMTTFTSDVDQNPGRLNLFHIRDFQVMLDYAHNQASYKSLIGTVRQLPHNRLIGVITAPGDRYPEKLREIGLIAGQGFDEVYVRQMKDLRGRPLGEAPDIILEGVREAGLDPSKVYRILDAADAVEAAIADGKAGDLIVVGCADTAALIAQVRGIAERNLPTVAQVSPFDLAPPVRSLPAPMAAPAAPAPLSNAIRSVDEVTWVAAASPNDGESGAKATAGRTEDNND
ncbi:MAG: cyanophycin synthetase [Candidatus Sericytochromatia bacterium]|nr:cyanophycin synthetase [Candidatus Sericytochromatia bacterium]